VNVIARTLTPEAKTFIREKSGDKYLALERSQDGNGTTAYFPECPDGVDIPGADFWSLPGYLELVT
jgi:hypothetical protein